MKLQKINNRCTTDNECNERASERELRNENECTVISHVNRETEEGIGAIRGIGRMSEIKSRMRMSEIKRSIENPEDEINQPNISSYGYMVTSTSTQPFQVKVSSCESQAYVNKIGAVDNNMVSPTETGVRSISAFAIEDNDTNPTIIRGGDPSNQFGDRSSISLYLGSRHYLSLECAYLYAENNAEGKRDKRVNVGWVKSRSTTLKRKHTLAREERLKLERTLGQSILRTGERLADTIDYAQEGELSKRKRIKQEHKQNLKIIEISAFECLQ